MPLGNPQQRDMQEDPLRDIVSTHVVFPHTNALRSGQAEVLKQNTDEDYSFENICAL